MEFAVLIFPADIPSHISFQIRTDLHASLLAALAASNEHIATPVTDETVSHLETAHFVFAKAAEDRETDDEPIANWSFAVFGDTDRPEFFGLLQQLCEFFFREKSVRGQNPLFHFAISWNIARARAVAIRPRGVLVM